MTATKTMDDAPKVAQETAADATTTEEPPTKNLDNIEFISSKDACPEKFAAFYLENQYANPNFRALGASNDDILTYGRNLHAICTMEPCMGITAVTKDTGDVVACHLVVTSDYLEHLDEEKLGQCAPHAALVKNYAKLMVQDWEHKGKENLVHHLYIGVLETYRGAGVYGMMGDLTQKLQHQHDCMWTWSYSTNPQILLKYLFGKKGTASGFSACNSNWFVATFMDKTMAGLLTCPEWVTTLVKNALVTFGYLSKDPLAITKIGNFTYNGEQPFKSNLLVVVAMYKSRIQGKRNIGEKGAVKPLA